MENKSAIPWVINSKHIADGMSGDLVIELLNLLNGLIEHETQYRKLPFEKDMGMTKQPSLDKFVTAGAHLVFITDPDTNEVIGTTIIRPVDSGKHRLGLLGFLHIKDAYRREGYGTYLMREAEIIARKMGCHAIRLSALGGNESAQEFYNDLGYSTTEIYMAKEL